MIYIEVEYDDIYLRYYPAVLRFALAREWPQAIAEEIANETLARLWERRAECDFDGEAALATWIYKTASFIIMEHKRKTKADTSLEACENYLSAEDPIRQTEETAQYAAYLSAIERRLSDRERQLFRKVFIERKSYAQCVAELHTRDGTMRVAISRLRKKLRPYIKDIVEKCDKI